MRRRKNFKFNAEVEELLTICSAAICSTDTRTVEHAIVAYGAKILGYNSEYVELARGKLREDMEKIRNK